MRICVPIKVKSFKKAQHIINKLAQYVLKKAEKLTIFVEIWLDFLREEEMKNIIQKSRFPVIAVCKGKEEKGDFMDSEKERVELLKKAARFGAKFIDCGIHTDKKLLADLKKVCSRTGVKLIISSHFWNETPEIRKLTDVVAKAKKFGADIVKIAVTVKKWSDNAVLFELVKRCDQKGNKVIIVGMGEKGKLSRIGCVLLGSYLTYVAFSDSSKTAPGQFALAEFILSLRAKRSNLDTGLDCFVVPHHFVLKMVRGSSQ